MWKDVKHIVCQKSYPSRKAVIWLDCLLLTWLILVWQPQKWFKLTSLPRPNVLKMKSMERKGVVIGSGVCGKCGLNVLTDKQFHLCRRQWCRFLKICLDDNRGGHCFGNIGGGARGVVLNSWCLIFFSREVKEESSSFRFCKEMIVDEFVEIFWISWIGVDSRVVAPQLQASSCWSCSCSSAPARISNINSDKNCKYHKLQIQTEMSIANTTKVNN